LPSQQEFQQFLRKLARGDIRIVLEEVMREEVDALIGVGWGECSRQQPRLSQWLLPARPRHVYWSDRGSERQKTIVKGGSTPKCSIAPAETRHRLQRASHRDVRGRREYARSVGEVAQTLMGMAKSASTISRLNRDLEQQFQAWRGRCLQAHWRVLYAGR
jgi:putative transposase